MTHDTYHHNGASKWTTRVLVRPAHVLKEECLKPMGPMLAVMESSLLASILVTILLLDKPCKVR